MEHHRRGNVLSEDLVSSAMVGVGLPEVSDKTFELACLFSDEWNPSKSAGESGARGLLIRGYYDTSELVERRDIRRGESEQK